MYTFSLVPSDYYNEDYLSLLIKQYGYNNKVLRTSIIVIWNILTHIFYIFGIDIDNDKNNNHNSIWSNNLSNRGMHGLNKMIILYLILYICC